MALPAQVETVVVGAGAAGSVIAARITEDDARQVLLVEAGPDHPTPDAVPADLLDARKNSMFDHDWGLRHRPTVPQLKFPLPRGRVVGGSSAVNTCIALRGNPVDYDAWAARGLSAWSWDQCLPAFRRLEHDLDFDDPWHGQDGPLPIRRDAPSQWSPWQAAFVAACERLGFPSCPDSNRPDSAGVGPHAFNRLHGRRVSAAEAWLTPTVRARPNLTLSPDTHVVRVTVQGDRATGIDVLHAGARHHIAARRVVLCGGALLTPTILLRSGIGPRAELDRLGVDVVRDLPAVGARVLDHPGSAIFLVPRPDIVDLRATALQTVLRYGGTGSGQPNDMQIQPGSVAYFPFATLPLVGIMGHVGKPRGTGTMHLPSADPLARPFVDSRFLEHPDDRAQAVEAMQLAHLVASQPETRALARPLWPRPRTLRDAGRTSAWIRYATDSGYHPCGTVPMGADDDPDAACDGRGRVRGVTGLVVADASLMPEIPQSNIHLPTLMIGERIGAWLRTPPD